MPDPSARQRRTTHLNTTETAYIRDRGGAPAPAAVLCPLLLLLLLSACARHEYTGSVFADASPAAQVRGRNYDGTGFDLTSLKGRPVLLFFGYTFCPDVCPLTMMELASAQELLRKDAPALAEDIAVVFVSIDPLRDSYGRLGTYVNAFDARFYGVRVEWEALQEIMPKYGLYVEVAQGQSLGDSHYLLDHSSGVYLIDREGNWRALFSADVSAADLAADLKALLR